MKFNWGWGLVILYVSFVAMILTMVYLSASQDFHLVTTNYYEAEVKYQNQIDKKDNSTGLKEKLQINYVPAGQAINFTFPAGPHPTGKILFYRPSDSSKDFSVDIQTGTGNSQTLSTNQVLKGLWKIQVDWQVNDVSYFDEKTVVLQ